MNTHKNARLTFIRRMEMVQEVTVQHRCIAAVARTFDLLAAREALALLATGMVKGKLVLTRRAPFPVGKPRPAPAFVPASVAAT